MNSVTSRLLRSPYTNDNLRRKLAACGAITRDSHRRWCRSPGCDRCRRYRARYLAEAVATWAVEVSATHLIAGDRLRVVDALTAPCRHPAALVAEIARVRRAMCRAHDYRQRRDRRWSDVQMYASWAPMWCSNDGGWYARLRGIAYLGQVSDGRYMAMMQAARVTLWPLPTGPLHGAVYNVITTAMTIVDGVRDCGPAALSALYAALDDHGGHKSLVARRGMQPS